jgi:hypothetical protein
MNTVLVSHVTAGPLPWQAPTTSYEVLGMTRVRWASTYVRRATRGRGSPTTTTTTTHTQMGSSHGAPPRARARPDTSRELTGRDGHRLPTPETSTSPHRLITLPPARCVARLRLPICVVLEASVHPTQRAGGQEAAARPCRARLGLARADPLGRAEQRPAACAFVVYLRPKKNCDNIYIYSFKLIYYKNIFHN